MTTGDPGNINIKSARNERLAKRSGVTLIELLIAIGIIGLLMQFILPAVQSSRESARRTQCANNLRQVALACLQHDSSMGRLPSSGWHFHWIGEPERGTGVDQPGGWVFNILGYLEQQTLRDLGTGLDGMARSEALITRTENPVPLFLCPSRRDIGVLRYTWNQNPFTKGGRLLRPLEFGAKSDYAANVGDGPDVEFDPAWPGPQTLDEGDTQTKWPEVAGTFTGVIYGRSSVKLRQITDGLSSTYLVGEKHVPADRYHSGEDPGDNESLYVGFNNDTCRSAVAPPEHDTGVVMRHNVFGGPHPTVWHVALCDGSVHAVTWEVDEDVHRRMGSRADSEVAAVGAVGK